MFVYVFMFGAQIHVVYAYGRTRGKMGVSRIGDTETTAPKL